MPSCQVILSVSGSAARKNTFFLPANSVTARPTFDRNVPQRMFNAFSGRQLLGDANRVARVGAVVARDDFEFFAEHAAGAVDLINRHLPALLVGLEKGGLCLVAVEFADPDRVLRRGRHRGADDSGERGSRSRAVRDVRVLQ